MLDGHENGVIDIAPKIHMLACVSCSWSDFASRLTLDKCRLDAISMTMFMHNVSAGEGQIPALLHEMSNSPNGDYFTIFMETLTSFFPSILYLPNPLKRYAEKIRIEFGKIAEEVWAGKDDAGMHAKVLDTLGNRDSIRFKTAEAYHFN
jgi:hypothetical protein